METIHIDRQVSKDCWNGYASYGEICVGCGCCSDDKKTRYTSRIECLNERIKEAKKFDMWDDDPKFRKIQKESISDSIQLWRDQIKYYKKALKAIDERIIEEA